MSEAPTQPSNGQEVNSTKKEPIMFEGRQALHQPEYKGPSRGQLPGRRPPLERKMTKEEEKAGEYYYQQQRLKV